MKSLFVSLALAAAVAAAPNMCFAQSTTAPTAGKREAATMVPAQAALWHGLDAKKVKAGYAIRARLSKKIVLEDGTEVPAGSMLLGEVQNDDMQVAGDSKLVLRFDKAQIKGGKTIPIKATIIGLFKPLDEDANGYPIAPGDQVSNYWTKQTLQVDQINVLPGVDLHSRIASSNSGVFVSTKKDDMKLREGSEFLLAIAPAHSA